MTCSNQIENAESLSMKICLANKHEKTGLQKQIKREKNAQALLDGHLYALYLIIKFKAFKKFAEENEILQEVENFKGFYKKISGFYATLKKEKLKCR